MRRRRTASALWSIRRRGGGQDLPTNVRWAFASTTPYDQRPTPTNVSPNVRTTSCTCTYFNNFSNINNRIGDLAGYFGASDGRNLSFGGNDWCVVFGWCVTVCMSWLCTCFVAAYLSIVDIWHLNGGESDCTGKIAPVSLNLDHHYFWRSFFKHLKKLHDLILYFFFVNRQPPNGSGYIIN